MLLLPSKLDSDSRLSKHFLPHQVAWIQAEKAVHEQRKQVVALAEKSVRIGWTYADAFKNVRKRLWFRDRDYLFATKDYPSALEYVRQCYKFAEIFNLTRAITSHGEESLSVNRLDDQGRPSTFTDDVKVGVIKFDNGSRIIAFSANPQAMAVYGGDVGLDEFAKHPNARLLWETAQGRVTWNYDFALWSSHDGEDTLFNEFAREARATCTHQPFKDAIHRVPSPRSLRGLLSRLLPGSAGVPAGESESSSSSSSSAYSISPHESRITHHDSSVGCAPSPATRHPAPVTSPWNLYFRVTLPDAISFGLVDAINRARGTKISPAQFLADCRARARDEEIFEQTYMCNPLGAATNHIVEWSAIERCRADYRIERVHLEADDITRRFGEFNPNSQTTRENEIQSFLHKKFPELLSGSSIENQNSKFKTPSNPKLRLGFDVAASGQGDLATIYIDEARGDELWLRALFTCRTEDWHFLKTVLFTFLRELPSVQAAGDESGLGRQICWEAASQFSGRFLKVNFASKKHDLGFALMNQLSTSQKRFPKSAQDIAADYFALRKRFTGSKWAFSEARNTLNPASHCDIAWAGALATEAHALKPMVLTARLG